MSSLSQPAGIFDPEYVLQRVWQGDYPPTWRVFFGPIGSAAACLLVALQAVLILIALLWLVAGVLTAVGEQSVPDALGDMAVIGVTLLVPTGLFVLLQRGIRAARRRASGRPRSAMVVLPEGVVAYRRKKTRAIAFASIAGMQLRVQARRQTITTYTTTNVGGITTTTPITTTVPAAPSIWLDLVFQDGQRGVWRIDIAPQDAIAQCILEVYTRYRAQFPI